MRSYVDASCVAAWMRHASCVAKSMRPCMKQPVPLPGSRYWTLTRVTLDASCVCAHAQGQSALPYQAASLAFFENPDVTHDVPSVNPAFSP